MAKIDFRSVDDYIASQPAASQTVLKRVRRIVRKVLPSAEEVISYNIPAYKLDGVVVLYFAGWKKHYSLYPVNESVVAGFNKAHVHFELSKGTIRFSLTEPVPVELIEHIANFRAQQSAAGAKTKRATRKKRRSGVSFFRKQ